MSPSSKFWLTTDPAGTPRQFLQTRFVALMGVHDVVVFDRVALTIVAYDGVSGIVGAAHSLMRYKAVKNAPVFLYSTWTFTSDGFLPELHPNTSMLYVPRFIVSMFLIQNAAFIIGTRWTIGATNADPSATLGTPTSSWQLTTVDPTPPKPPHVNKPPKPPKLPFE